MADILRKSFQQFAEEAGYPSEWGDKVVGQMDDLRKALALGSYPTTAGSQFSDAGPLRLQNLDATMTSVLFTEQYIKLYNFLTKTPSPQPYYEWNRRRSYGSSRGSTGFAEGGAPKGGVSAFERNGIYNKYKGTRRGITHQLSLTGQLMGTQIDPVAEENRNGTLALLENIERDLMFGQETILDESGAKVNWDGILAQADANYGPANLGFATHIIDKKGAPMSFTDFDDIGESLYKTGFVSNFDDLHCFVTPSVLTDLSKIKIETGTVQSPSSVFGLVGATAATSVSGQNVDRRLLPAGQSGYTTGMPLKGHMTNFGFFAFDPWIFAERVKGDTPISTAEANAPATPAAPTAADASSSTGSAWTTGQAALGHTYKIAAFNDSGESAVSAVSGSVTQAGTNNVTVTFPAVPSGNPTGWRIYRDDAARTKWQWIADSAITNTTLTDKNFKIPGTGYVFVLNKNPETMVVSQMTPLIRYPLAIVSTTVEWLLLLYLVPVLKAGERIAIFKNVGRI